MIYGEQKAKEMSRSVLPSSSRKSARISKAKARRRNRHSIHQNLHVIAEYDEWDEDFHATDDGQKSGIMSTRVVVQERRGADKIAPIMRWAEAHRDDWGDSPDARITQVRKILSADPMGNRAVSHVENVPGFDTNPLYRYYGTKGLNETWEAYYIRRRKEAKAEAQSRFDRMCNALRANLHRVGDVNRAMKQGHKCYNVDENGNPFPCPHDWRVWEGAHDIEGFATYCLSNFTGYRWALDGTGRYRRSDRRNPLDEILEIPQ